ncbi:transmembrane protein 135 [Trichonephila inaurata madagascariensis]|uniref:Transmembrane protein 135 n=1 Tax=Trichonephila inaurata madagascariensis TaxID=2747483 RepID=A0A8X6WNM1_9ARAC|nr:transmembrane protein 135 [Trichonephila inaurata madagascariensis]
MLKRVDLFAIRDFTTVLQREKTSITSRAFARSWNIGWDQDILDKPREEVVAELSVRITGKFYYLNCSFFPGFVAGLLSILIETESRRSPLTLYVISTATEIIFRMAVVRKMVKPIPNFDIFIFSATMALYFYIIKKHGYGKEFVSSALRFLFGKDEAIKSIKGKKPSSILNSLVNTNVHVREGLLDNAVSNIVPQCNKTQHLLPKIIFSSIKHASCPHSSSCLLYCLQGFLRPFLTGYLISFGFRCLSDGKQLMINPSLVLDLLIEKKSLNLGLFLGGFGGTYRKKSLLQIRAWVTVGTIV